jgi:uncharacterized membrane protein YbhN (UPF0104 family)
VSWVLLALVLVVGIVVVARNRAELEQAFREIGWGAMLVSASLAVAGTVALVPLWTALLHGLGVGPPRREGWAVFFVSQLGKYLPGLLWPALAQMEAGHRWGARRSVMLAANLLLIAVLASSGVVVGLTLLPWSVGITGVSWWAWLAAGALALVCVWPGMLTRVVDELFRLVKRDPPGLVVPPGAMARAYAWAVLVWAVYGLQVAVLVRAVGGSGTDAWAASVGGMALGWALGLVAVFAPAGLGVREAVLVASLAPVVGRTPALAVALASRGVLAVCDVLLGLVGSRRAARVAGVGASGTAEQ